MDSLTYLQLLRRNRSFRRLWWGQVISELGNWFNFIAGLGLVRMMSHGDAAVTTIMLLARMVPFTVFAPLAGAFVDRWSRRMVMIVSDFARVVVALGFLLVRRPGRSLDRLPLHGAALILWFVLRGGEECGHAQHHRRARLAGGKCADVFFALSVDVARRRAWRLDCRQRRLSRGFHRQRRVVPWFSFVGLAYSGAGNKATCVGAGSEPDGKES